MTVSHGKLLLLLGLLLPAMAMSREWYVRPSAILRGEYSDNLLLRAGKTPKVYGYQATFLGVGGMRSEVSNIALMAQADIYRYWGQEGLDRNNWNIGLNADYSLTERSKVGLDAGYISDTSLTSELLITGNLASLTGKQFGRQSINVAPRWSYDLSETKVLSANYGHQEVTFDTAASDSSSAASFRSYNTDSVGLIYKEQWTAATNYNLAFNALHYVLTDIDTKNYSLTFGLDHKYSDTLSFNFMAGVRRTDTDAMVPVRQLVQGPNGLEFITKQNSKSASGYGPLFGAGLIKQFDRGNVSLNYMRNTSPSGIGQLLVSDNINGNASYDLTEHLKVLFSAGAAFSTSASSQSTASNFNRSYYSVGSTLSWMFNKQLSLNGGYLYQTQQYDYVASNTNASSNNIFVYFDYHLDELTTNRF
ncbi:MAG: hypothetical protein HOP02_07945 [Methylococcaceae bacterium]|nr:hypothetical protein [Methylococcaceae bacterium]